MFALIPATLVAWSWDDLSLRSLTSEQAWRLSFTVIPAVLIAVAIVGLLLSLRPRHPRTR